MNNHPDQNYVNVLLIEDDSEYAELRRKILSRQKNPRFFTECAQNLEDALARLTQGNIDVVLMDLGLPDSQGLDSFIKLHDQAPEVPVVILSGVDDETLALEAVRSGAQDYLVKGQIDSAFLVRTILYAIERQHIRKELATVTSELLAANEQLERLALLDPLTELLNRRGLQQVLSREIKLGQREGSIPPLVLLLDLDDFKRINDTLGHAVGDIALKEISRKLKNTLRSSDYIARIGGDEFMILLPQTRPAEGVRVAEKIRLSICETPVLLSSGKAVEVTASLGLATVSEETPSIDELLSKTHFVLYESKRTGKNRVSYDVEVDSKNSQDENSLPTILAALSGGKRFHALRQPIVQLSDGAGIGYEFLSRSSIVVFENPEHFFRICLEHNILTLVDHHCLKTCMASAASLLPGIRCHLNLFPSTIIDIPVHHLLEIFPKERRDGTYCIEISEQQIIGDPSYLIQAVETFKLAGIQVAIDDVGFGRSCLESLILLEPNIVKIDKRCVNGIAHDKAQAQSFKRILGVAVSLGAEVVAEGIESNEDLELLKDLGVKYGQGYLLGKPAV